MAKIPNGLLKQWKDGDMVHADDYQRERDTMTAAINDIDDKVTTLTQTSGTTTATLNALGTAVNNKTDLTGDHQGTWQGNTPSGLIANKADKTTVGALSSLATSDKSSIVNAINEVRSTSGVAPDWSVVQNKPATFPPSAHTHPISDVTNLQSSLDGKSPVGHTHVISDVSNLQTTLDGKLPITGGTLTGALTLSNSNIIYSDGSTSTTAIKFKNGSSIGHGMAIGVGGSTLIGGGEAPTTILNDTTNGITDVTRETLYLVADSDIQIWTGVQSGVVASKKSSFDTSGNLLVSNTISEGGTLLSNKYAAKATTLSGYGITDGATTAQVGTLSSLTTTAKGDLVSAINEVNAKPSGGGTWGSITGTLSSQTDLNNALNAKAPLASPALTGTPTAPTVATSDNSTSIATTAWVKAQGYGGAGSAAWGSITGTLANQTDLNTALAGKSDTSHTHAFSSLTGITTTISDFNTITSTGFYHAPSTATNQPTGSQAWEVTVIGNGTNIIQFAVSSGTQGVTYQRRSTDGGTTWLTWIQVLTGGQLTQTPSSSISTPLSAAGLFNLGYSDGNYTIYNSATATDLNTTLTSTCFRYLTGTLTNQPSGVTTNVFIKHYRLVGSTDVIQHLWTNESTPRYFIRAKTAGTWNSWTQINDWNGISNKPSTFTPSAHTHVVADITDLSTNYYNKTEVDAKVSTYNSFADLNRWIN
jgi:hypothetical protein